MFGKKKRKKKNLVNRSCQSVSRQSSRQVRIAVSPSSTRLVAIAVSYRKTKGGTQNTSLPPQNVVEVLPCRGMKRIKCASRVMVEQVLIHALIQQPRLCIETHWGQHWSHGAILNKVLGTNAARLVRRA